MSSHLVASDTDTRLNYFVKWQARFQSSVAAARIAGSNTITVQTKNNPPDSGTATLAAVSGPTP